MEIDEIVDYVTKTPENTNPAVLRSMLSQYGSSGSDPDSGEIFWITYTVDAIASDESDETVFICDHTYQEIREAINNNKIVIAKYNNGIYYLANAGLFSVSFCLSRIEMSEEGIPYELYWALFTHEETGNIICGNYTENIGDDPLILYINESQLADHTGGLIYLNPGLTETIGMSELGDALRASTNIIVYGSVNEGYNLILHSPELINQSELYLGTWSGDSHTTVRFTTIDA